MQSQILSVSVQELRRARRFPIAAPLRYRLSREGDWQTARTENISSTGLLFRCENVEGRGERIEMNFLLLKSVRDRAGLEVACEGEVVRLDFPLEEDELPALAVNFTAYRLGPGTTGRWDLGDESRKTGTDE